MKTKTKTLALAEIALVLCSVFLVALPSIAGDQTTQKTITTASEDEFTLDIYGNANEDDTIDMRDTTYIKLVIFGKKTKTDLADANNDGKVSMLDVGQTKLIILGKEKKLTIIDGNGEPVTVSKPVERIVVEYKDAPELLRILNAEDKIVGVSDYIKKWETVLFPEFSELPSIGIWPIDYEAVLSLDPDVLLTFGGYTAEYKEKLPGVAVIFLGLYWPDLLNPEKSNPTAGIRKLGYILDKEEEAEEYINWRIDWINEIKARTEGLSEDERPKVFYTFSWGEAVGKLQYTLSKRDTCTQMCIIAGGKSMAEDLPEFVQTGPFIEVDREWVIAQNPDIIVVHVMLEQVAHAYGVDDPSEVAAGREDILNRPDLANVNAVKTGSVYITSGNFRNDASCGVTGAAYLAKLFHPSLFEDLDPEAIHQEYLKFQHVDYDLDEHGVFVYPPIEINGGLAGIPDKWQ